MNKELLAKLSVSGKGTVTFTVKVKYLWLVVGILLVLLAVAPVVYSYIPATTSSTPSGGGGSGGGGGSNSGGGGSGAPTVNCQNPCVLYIKNSVFGYNVTQPTVVKVGTKVTWFNIDDTEHTTTSNTGIWDSGVMPVGSTYSVTFNSTGTFPYHCNIHPMTGTIVVVS